jgi:hypothetical protein
MFRTKVLTGMCVSMALFACSPAEMPSRGLTDVFPAVAGPAAEAVAAKDAVTVGYDIVSYSVSVPKSLLVSEADVYLPIADIVWHGDPEGDRHAQVKALFMTGFESGTTGMTAGRAVTVDVQVEKFHALTPKTRATFGGNFAMHFFLTVYDANTHAIIDGPRLVIADTPASGGVKALREEAAGITQTTVITGHLASVFREELSRPAMPTAAPNLVSRNAFSPSDLTLAE